LEALHHHPALPAMPPVIPGDLAGCFLPKDSALDTLVPPHLQRIEKQRDHLIESLRKPTLYLHKRPTVQAIGWKKALIRSERKI
jgi:hypothetical protein